MLQDRGYSNIMSKGLTNVLIYSCLDVKKELTLIFLSHEDRVGVKTLRTIKQDCETLNSSHFILLSHNGLTPFALRELNECSGNADVEIFKKADLAFPIVRHILVPKHIALSKEEKAELLEDLPSKALPKLKESDPVARYYHFPIGTVVKIHRQLGTNPEPYYRIVV